MQPDAVRRKISRSKPDRVFRQSLKQDRGKGYKKQARNRGLGKFIGKRELVGCGAGSGLSIEVALSVAFGYNNDKQCKRRSAPDMFL